MTKLNASHKAIICGRICPYCHGKTKFMDSIKVYKNRSYGMVYACLPCSAWVGVHKKTNKALGRLANAELRQLKMQAHQYFDPIWQRAVDGGVDKYTARNAAYKWLAKEMGIDRELCHIGYFNEKQCRQVLDIIFEWEEKYPGFFI